MHMWLSREGGELCRIVRTESARVGRLVVAAAPLQGECRGLLRPKSTALLRATTAVHHSFTHLPGLLISLRSCSSPSKGHREKKARGAQRRADHVHVCVMCDMPCRRPGDCVDISNAGTD